jgi:hypothetical protein
MVRPHLADEEAASARRAEPASQPASVEKARRKQFFFEKKNQKTFEFCSQPRGRITGSNAAAKSQKFFVSFFQKRNTSLLALGLSQRDVNRTRS